MADEIGKPFLVRYGGRDADSHILQADVFGESILGGARFYTAVAHYCFFGFVPGRKYKKELVCFARPTAPGSVDQWFFVGAAIGGQYALHAALYNEAFSYIFGKVCDGVKDLWTRRSETQQVVDRLAAALEEQARLNADVQGQLINGLIRSNDGMQALQSKLIDTLPALAATTHPHGILFVAPVGPSCSNIAQFAETQMESRITEGDATAIRGEGDTEVGSVAEYRVSRIREINLTTGHCIVDVEALGQVSGKITDPTLKEPNNVYTVALNEHTPCTVTAKPVRKNGEVHQLFISDAKP